MKEKIKNYFTIWWISLSFYLIPLTVFILGIFLERDWIIDLSLVILLVNMLGTLISSVIQVLIGNWYFIIPQVVVTGFLFFCTSFLFMFSPPDYYGSHKEIPQDIEIDEPLEVQPTKEDFDAYDLVLVSSVQPGIYYYFTDFKPNEIGHLYIKAYDIVSNNRLSKARMEERSKVEVRDIKADYYSGEFTIYEGSWGDKYGSRIELWFQPLNGNNEFKVTERNFIVEGWMR